MAMASTGPVLYPLLPYLRSRPGIFREFHDEVKDRSEVFQAVSVGKLMEKLQVKKYHLMGTSYGGFVAYHMAKMCPDKVEKVVIASSGVNMRKADNVDLLKRANTKTIEEIMLPKTATQLRTLTRLAVSKRVNIIPDFLLNDFDEGGGRRERERAKLNHGEFLPVTQPLIDQFY